MNINNRISYKALLWLLLPLFTACQVNGGGGSVQQNQFAQLFSMQELPDGGVAFEITDPWDTTRMLQSLSIEKPFGRVMVGSEVHYGLFKMLGCADRVEMFDEMNPNVELIVQHHPDAVFISPFEDGDYSKLDRLGIPIIRCADYMEPTALGRAEWMRLYGRLMGVANVSDSIFNRVSENYQCYIVSVDTGMPCLKVLTDLRYGQTWYQPAGRSTIAQLYHDAGMQAAFAADQSRGSLALSAEQVLAGAADADLWIIRYDGEQPLTLQRLADLSPMHQQFKAWQTGYVYYTKNIDVGFFFIQAFRPDIILHDLINMGKSCSRNLNGDVLLYKQCARE